MIPIPRLIDSQNFQNEIGNGNEIGNEIGNENES